MWGDKFDLNKLRDKSRIGGFTMVDFAGSYLIAIIIYLVGLYADDWSGLTFIKIMLSIIPLSIASHIIGPYLGINTKRNVCEEDSESGVLMEGCEEDTPLTKLFLSNDCSCGSIFTKAVVIGSVALIVCL